MPKRLVSGLAVGSLVLGYCLAASAASPPSSQNATSQPVRPVPATPPTAATSRPEPSTGHQMQALAGHARVNMVLYKGRFDRGDFAMKKKQIDVFAVGLKPERK